MTKNFQSWELMTKIVKWKVHRFRKSGLLVYKYTSPCIEIGREKFEISITENIGYSSKFYMHLLPNIKNKYEFNYEIGVQKLDGSVCEVKDKTYTFRVMNTLKTNCGSSAFLCTDIFNEDGSMTVVCNVYSKQEIGIVRKHIPLRCFQDISSQTSSLECIETLSGSYKDLLGNSRHADVKIKVGRKEFQAHKSVLAARSPVLDSMLPNEVIENNTAVLNIEYADEDTFEAVMIFLYSGKIEKIPSDKVKGLYELAEKYDLQELQRECVKRFVIEMSVDLVCDALIVSTLYSEEMLFEIATKYFIDNAEKIIDTPKWESFFNDHPQIGNVLYKKCFNTRLN